MAELKQSDHLICSQMKDATTDLVLLYLAHFGGVFARINIEDQITEFSCYLGESRLEDRITLSCKDKSININGETRLWYRRGNFSIPKINCENSELRRHLADEHAIFKSFLHKHVTYVGNYDREKHNNKLINLGIARDCGLKIPRTVVTCRKTDLEWLGNNGQGIVCKPIHNGHIYYEEEQELVYSPGIILLNEEKINEMPEKFGLSKFQEYISKRIELRIFFIFDNIYAMAIFSQLDEMTKYDFRNYNKEKPNRNVPYNLPFRILSKVKDFISCSGLTTGSIDMILSENNEYVFLEVNPSGQFGWVSANCNYYIEKEIATKILTK